MMLKPAPTLICGQVREMGVGAFGVVVSARDDISGEHVAIKQINRVFDKARPGAQ